MAHFEGKYTEFLNKNFPGLVLETPIFYKWTIGLRFNLQGEYDTDNEEYFKEAIERALKIFESIFSPEDEVFLIVSEDRVRKRKLRITNYPFSQVNNLDKKQVFFNKMKSLFNIGKYRNVVSTSTKIKNINYKNIIIAISNSDFPPREPRMDNLGMLTSKEIYFINKKKGIIFHMYDDRGIDVIASHKSELMEIYGDLNDLLLDYNRADINNTFNS